MQLELTSPLRLPIPVEIQQDVDPPVQEQLALGCEVVVQTQEAACRDLHVARGVHVGVGNQPQDARQGFQEAHEPRAVERMRDRFGRGPERSRVRTDLFTLVDRLVSRPPGLDSRQLGDGLIQQRGREQVIEHDVWKRTRHAISRAAVRRDLREAVPLDDGRGDQGRSLAVRAERAGA